MPQEQTKKVAQLGKKWQGIRWNKEKFVSSELSLYKCIKG